MSSPASARPQDRITGCARIAAGLVAVGLLATLARVAQLKLAPNEHLEGRSGARRALSTEPKFRGTVFDRAGRTVAIDRPVWKLALDPRYYLEHGSRRLSAAEGTPTGELGGLEADRNLARYSGPLGLVREQVRVAKMRLLCRELAARTGLSREQLEERLGPLTSDRRYAVIKPILDDWEVDLLKQWTGEQRLGLILDKTTRRVTYGPDSLEMIVGKVRANGNGGSGVEQKFDLSLKARDGSLRSKRTSRGTVISIPEGSYRPGAHGSDFHLTLDLRIQELVERRLAAQLEKYNAGGGRCVVIDPRNGDVLAMVDLLRRRSEVEEAILDDPMRRLEGSLARNRNLVDSFEPGSTFKPFVWAGAVELGVGAGRPVPTDGAGRIMVNLKPVPVPGRRNSVKDAGISPYKGPLEDIETILVRSLNTGMIEMVRPLSDRETREILLRFGFGSRTNCGLAGSAEHAGQVTAIENWSYANTSVSVSFGHEVSVTTVQMARAFSAFCNGGLMPQLRIVRPIPDPDGQPVVDSARLMMSRAIGSEIAERTKRALGKVVTEGTLSRHARSGSYSMFGKSGTADLANPEGGYFKDRHTSNVIAGAPFHDTRIVVYCVIDDPQKSIGYYGGLVAGPVVKDLVDEILSYQGVVPDLGGPETPRESRLVDSGRRPGPPLGGG